MVYDFITIGGSTEDISVVTAEGVIVDNPGDLLRQELLGFEYGAKIRVDQFQQSFGGGGANTAVNLANFGFKVACFSAIGDDLVGKEIRANLARRGVDHSQLQVIKGAKSGRSFILISQGERVIFTERGANAKLAIRKKDLALLKNTKHIYISSLSGAWQGKLKQIFAVVKANGIKVFWNPSEAQYQAGLAKLRPYLEKTYLFVVNKDEAIELALSTSYKKKSQQFLNQEENLLKIIYRYGPKLVMITSGPKGAYLFDGKQVYFQPAFPEKKRVDMTGVGDVFNSTVAAGLSLYSLDIEKAMLLAAKNTASKISHFGAQNGLIKWNK